MVKLRSVLDRVESCRRRYWTIAKADRIAFGLTTDARSDVASDAYSGNDVIVAVEYTVRRALLHGFPISYDPNSAAVLGYFGGTEVLMERYAETGDEVVITSPLALYDVLSPELSELEGRLETAEAALSGRHGRSAEG